MKAFKEFCKGGCPAPDDTNCGHMTCRECGRVQEAVWRAALEWLRSESYAGDSCQVVNDIIEDELEVTE